MPEKINLYYRWIRNNWDEIAVYLLTLWCTLLSSNLEQLKEGENIILSFDVSKIILSATIALLLTFAQEWIFPEKDTAAVTKEQKKIGKRKHIAKRMVFAMAFGFSAPNIVTLIINSVTKLSGLGL